MIPRDCAVVQWAVAPPSLWMVLALLQVQLLLQWHNISGMCLKDNLPIVKILNFSSLYPRDSRITELCLVFVVQIIKCTEISVRIEQEYAYRVTPHTLRLSTL